MDFGLDRIAPKKNNEPTILNSIYYLFFRKGIDFNDFNKLPIPYIVDVLDTYSYYKEKEAEAMKKK